MVETNDSPIPASLPEVTDATNSSAVKPAESGVTAFVGHSAHGPKGEPVECLSVSAFNQHFGDHTDAPHLAAAVGGFFQNGGHRCVVLNLGPRDRPLAIGDLDGLDPIVDVEFVCAPGKTTTTDYEVLISHCTHQGTRLAILDGPEHLASQLARLRPPSARHAALYVPWLRCYDPSRAAEIDAPPSGHIAGMMARVGREKGVHVAPANEALAGVVGLSYELTKAEQDILHPRQVNCVRPVRHLDGLRVWSEQTAEAKGPFRSISSFRLFSHVVRSIERGVSWLAGEPSEPALWDRLSEAVAPLLTSLWEAGALRGESPQQAFRIRCDGTLNPMSTRDKGIVVLEIGLAMNRPGAFFTFQMGLELAP